MHTCAPMCTHVHSLHTKEEKEGFGEGERNKERHGEGEKGSERGRRASGFSLDLFFFFWLD